jgi:hypothetical protein
MIPRMLLAAALSLAVVPCASAQIRVNSVSVGHVTSSHAGLLPYIRSTQGINGWRGPITKSYGGDNNRTFNGGVRGNKAGSAQWGDGRAAATGSSGSIGH